MAKLYSELQIQEINTDNYFLYQRDDGYKILLFKKVSEESGGWHMCDDDSYITHFCTEAQYISGQSILIIGLGFGLISYYIRNNFQQIDILEKESDLISLIASQNLTTSNVNIICGDGLTYTFDEGKKWDYIVVDVFWEPPNLSVIEEYKQKYLPKLNPNGFLYIPINYNQKVFN